MGESDQNVAVKICGITNVADALLCAAAGADMLGLNFSPRSLRCIERESGAEIVTAVRAKFPQIKLVGVFVDQDLAVVQKIAADLALDGVQLHGEESPDYACALALPATTFVTKAVRVREAFSAADVSAYQCDAILLDTWDGVTPGGTGRTFPWSIAAALRPRVKRLILAGGLTSKNVGEAIRTVRPFAVDICSGVEIVPGRKDATEVRAFLEACSTCRGGRAGRRSRSKIKSKSRR